MFDSLTRYLWKIKRKEKRKNIVNAKKSLSLEIFLNLMITSVLNMDEIRVKAIELTNSHFSRMTTPPTEKAFMSHLEKIYKFLKQGTLSSEESLTDEEREIIKTFKQ